MKKTIKLTESELTRIIKRIIKEQVSPQDPMNTIMGCLPKDIKVDMNKIPQSCKSLNQQSSVDKVVSCLTELGITNAMTAFSVGSCVVGKLSGKDNPLGRLPVSF